MDPLFTKEQLNNMKHEELVKLKDNGFVRVLQWIFYCRKCYGFEFRFVTVLFYTKQP